MGKPVIEMIPPNQLRPWPRNARTHSRKQIRQITDSITRFRFTSPVLVNRENAILAGHGRVEAARQLAMRTVTGLRGPVLVCNDGRRSIAWKQGQSRERGSPSLAGRRPMFGL